MSWDYRVVKMVNDDLELSDTFNIHEVYYDEDLNPCGMTEEPVGLPCLDSVEDVRDSLQKMLEATDKPVLDWKQIVKENG